MSEWLTAFITLAFVLAVGPCVLYFVNTRALKPPPRSSRRHAVSVLIPARDEEGVIANVVESALANIDVDSEVIVLDDHSADRTAAIVNEIALKDGRVRLLQSSPLPGGWCGKQYACHQLAQAARHDIYIFVDADVTLARDGLGRMAEFLERSSASLVSGFPRQVTGTLLEKMVIPLIHFLLLGFLPIARMRKDPRPAMSAGCGQFMVAKRADYWAMGGHEAIRTTLHDGVKLPRAFRKAGFRTDLCDATDVASCRMYRGAKQVWFGFAKNAREGLAASAVIAPFTLVLTLGQIVPTLLAICNIVGLLEFTTPQWVLLAFALLASYAPRLDAAWRFRQSWLGALLHPFGVDVLLMIQWFALLRHAFGRPAAWKGRNYAG